MAKDTAKRFAKHLKTIHKGSLALQLHDLKQKHVFSCPFDIYSKEQNRALPISYSKDFLYKLA